MGVILGPRHDTKSRRTEQLLNNEGTSRMRGGAQSGQFPAKLLSKLPLRVQTVTVFRSKPPRGDTACHLDKTRSQSGLSETRFRLSYSLHI